MADSDLNGCPVIDSGMAVVFAGCRESQAIALVGTRLFWGDDNVREAMKDGGSPLIVGRGIPGGIAATLTDVYWTDGWGGFLGKVYKAPIAGGPSTVVASGQDAPLDIVVDEVNVYWGNAFSLTIMKAPLAGGLAVALATGTARTGPAGPHGVALDDTNVYWGNLDGTIMTVPKVGGAVGILAQGQDTNTRFVAVDATNVYWTNPYSGTVMKVSKTGGAPITIATAQAYSLAGIATDGVNVYWANGPIVGPGSIMRVAARGGSPTEIASSLHGPKQVALDDTNVYWTTGFGVMRAPK